MVSLLATPVSVVGNDSVQSDAYGKNVVNKINYCIDKGYIGKGPVCAIISLNYKASSVNLKSETNSIDELQENVINIRELNKGYYTEMNHLALKELECGDLQFRCSSYSPFLFYEFDNYEEFANRIDVLESISKKEIVENIYVEPSIDFTPECVINDDDSLKLVPIATAKSMIGVNSSSFTGDGIKVGIVDGGIPYSTNFGGGQLKDTYGTNYSDHTTKVASIIGGTYGIATDADLYVRSLSNEFDSSIEWLLDRGVNVINMSMGSALNAIYDGRSAYLDYIVANEHVSIVKSAGNRGGVNSDAFITSPGMGLNVFAVGSVDGDENLSWFSSHSVNAENYGVVMKPTLVAPGENVIVPNTLNSALNEAGTSLTFSYSGTSFAAPMVTGCLALLMEQFPQLISSPELAMSAIVNGAKKLPSQTTRWDANCGAGLLNYPETVSILSGGYVLGTLPDNASNGFLAGSRNFTIPAKSYVDLSFVHTIRSTTTMPSFASIPLSFSKYNIVITDSNGLVVATSSNNSNLQLLTVNNTESTPKTMTASVYLNGSKIENGTEYSALTFFAHNHVYNHRYENYSSTKHKAYCECGEYIFSLHSPNTFHSYISNGHIYTSCVFCGALMDLGGDGPIIPVNPFSNNGAM